MVAIFGPFSAHFQSHFQVIFMYLAGEQTKGNEKMMWKIVTVNTLILSSSDPLQGGYYVAIIVYF